MTNEDVLATNGRVGDRDDVHGLRSCGPAVYAIYAVAKASRARLKKKMMDVHEMQRQLIEMAPCGPYKRKGHARIVFKLMNPSGHGANGKRFQNVTLDWFRTHHPEDAHLTDGLVLFICACKWWNEDKGRGSIYPGLPPLITSDFDKKLRSFGHLEGERDTLCKLLRS